MIVFSEGSVSSWHTEEDQESDTSTPGYKRGIHSGDRPVLEKVRQEGLSAAIPSWCKSVVAQSIAIIDDGLLSEWPSKDRKCGVLSMNAHLKECAAKIRERQVSVDFPIVVINLQGIRIVKGMEPLKNGLAALCRAIRSQAPHGQIFIASYMVEPYQTSALQTWAIQLNPSLQMAVQGININSRKYFT